MTQDTVVSSPVVAQPVNPSRPNTRNAASYQHAEWVNLLSATKRTVEEIQLQKLVPEEEVSSQTLFVLPQFLSKFAENLAAFMTLSKHFEHHYLVKALKPLFHNNLSVWTFRPERSNSALLANCRMLDSAYLLLQSDSNSNLVLDNTARIFNEYLTSIQ